MRMLEKVVLALKDNDFALIIGKPNNNNPFIIVDVLISTLVRVVKYNVVINKHHLWGVIASKVCWGGVAGNNA